MDYKKVAILMTGLVMVLGTMTAFAVWDDLNESVSNNTIEIGQGLEIVVSQESIGDWIGAGQSLIPDDENILQKENDVTLATKTFEINYTPSASLPPSEYFVDVNYTALGVYDDSSDTTADTSAGTLALIAVSMSWTVSDPVTGPWTEFENNTREFDDASLPDLQVLTYVKFEVTLNVPTTDAEYDAISGKEIRLTLNFEARKLF